METERTCTRCGEKTQLPDYIFRESGEYFCTRCLKEIADEKLKEEEK